MKVIRIEKAPEALQLFAYYLSRYDMDAVKALGFKNRTQAMDAINERFYQKNGYLKLRRDDCDVVTGSHRNGWRNRPVTANVAVHAERYSHFSFEQMELTKKHCRGGTQVDNKDYTTQLAEMLQKFSGSRESVHSDDDDGCKAHDGNGNQWASACGKKRTE